MEDEEEKVKEGNLLDILQEHVLFNAPVTEINTTKESLSDLDSNSLKKMEETSHKIRALVEGFEMRYNKLELEMNAVEELEQSKYQRMIMETN